MLRARWLVSGFLILLCGALASCAGLGSTASFAGTSWTLESLNGAAPLENTQLTLEFGNGTVGGSSGCNSYSGTFSATDTELAFSPLASTEMACETAIMDQEAAFFVALGSEVVYVRSDTRLGLTNKNNAQVLVFVQTPTE